MEKGKYGFRESIYKHYRPAVTSHREKIDKAIGLRFCLNKLLVTVGDDKVRIPYSKSLADLRSLRLGYSTWHSAGTPLLFGRAARESAAPEECHSEI